MRERITAIFKSWDANGDGQLSVRELSKVFKKLGVSLTSQQSSLLLAEADTNADGAIDLEEFVAWLYGGNSESLSDEDRQHVIPETLRHMLFLSSTYGQIAKKCVLYFTIYDAC